MMTGRFIYPFQFRLSITHVCNWLSLDKGAKFCCYKRYLFYNDCCKELNTSKDVLLKKIHCIIFISCSCRDSKYCKYLYKNVQKTCQPKKGWNIIKYRNKHKINVWLDRDRTMHPSFASKISPPLSFIKVNNIFGPSSPNYHIPFSTQKTHNKHKFTLSGFSDWTNA